MLGVVRSLKDKRVGVLVTLPNRVELWLPIDVAENLTHRLRVVLQRPPEKGEAGDDPPGGG